MSEMKENKDVACYFITKISWKGKYKRVFSIGTRGITTYNPSTMGVTNQWPYSEFISITPFTKSVNQVNDFAITMKKGKKTDKTDTMKFSSENRANVLTEALKYRHLFANPVKDIVKFNAYKLHWSDTRLPIVLEINQGSLDQKDPTSGKLLASYDYKDIQNVTLVSDYPGGFVISYDSFKRMHFFISEKRDEIVKRIKESASAYIGVVVRIPKEQITVEDFQTEKFGKFSHDEAITSVAEFNVYKISPRHNNEPVKRILALTESCLIERDPATYSIITLKPLSEIFSIVRSAQDLQVFSVEYLRDSLLATIIDGVRGSGNKDIHVKINPTVRGYRLGPFTVHLDEEVESTHLKFLLNAHGWTFHEAVQRFNSNIAYSGLLHAVTQDGLFSENKEKAINEALCALLDKEGDQNKISSSELEAQFHALRRLFASKAGFGAFTNIPKIREKLGNKVVIALRRNNEAVSYAAVDMICALMQPMHDDYDLRQEQLNKASLLSSKKFLETLLDKFTNHTVSRSVFKLFQHPSMAIMKGAGLVMKAIIEEGEAEISANMQELALSEGALPRHLHTALFVQTTDSRLLALRQLSRHLVGLWVTSHSTAMALLSRIFVIFWNSKEAVPSHDKDLLNIRDNLKIAQDHSFRNQKNVPWKVVEKQLEKVLQHWRSNLSLQKENQMKPIVLRKRRERIKSEANWPLFYYKFNLDHTEPNLIWNLKTREELRDCLENEMRLFMVDKDLSSGNIIVAWNHAEFEVLYTCLSDEIKIGEYYLRYLLEQDDTSNNSFIKRPYEFFNDLYHRFLLTSKTAMKCMCLQAMTIVYSRYHEEIGAFNDTRYIVGMDRLILFISKLFLTKKNVKEFVDANGLRVLVDMLTIAHLHTSRATVPLQSNLIEGSPDMIRDTEKEWYFGNPEKERLGPFSFNEMKTFWKEGKLNAKTRCWAQGMDGWRPLHSAPQLKWTLLATSQHVMNESDLATQILNMLIQICDYYPSQNAEGAIIRPIPRTKRLLSDATCLPHIVQLLLTFDPVLVEKVAVLINTIMQDNPILSRLYLSGVFFFIMMYTGSNVLPIGRFLQQTHLIQAFRSEESSDIMQKSILGQILPEAMVCYLENHGHEKFSELFLGDFDTPEAIWNNEMRRMMIEKIAAHIADFTPRLQSNTRATYQYCPIPIIQYPQLENELFCNIYYLRHLCDTTKFPDWPIREPVKLLKEILEAWKKEVDKKPPTMSIDDAYKVLEFDANQSHDESKIRKAYFKLAQKYHPDKNPKGREKFEEVNKAYEFLCSKDSKCTDGPDPHNILLILKAQSILFSRYSDVLQPYKYSGYPMLIKTIKMETGDTQLFSKSIPILAAAVETAYHTVNCSALNAEELRREHGLEILQDALARCVNVISKSSKPEDIAVQVCIHIAKCYSVAAGFPACCEKIVEMPDMIKDLCRILYYKQIPKLCLVVTECISALSIDVIIQTHLFKAGAFLHLLLFLFNYDFTLDEGGVERSEDYNQQETANQLARVSVFACGRLGGYLGGEMATPQNHDIQRALRALLTPYLAKQLHKNYPAEVLKLINSNSENPYLIWDNQTRGESDPSYGANFVYTVHSSELVIGEIFVRIYNEQPTFPIEDSKKFTIDLLDYLGSQAQYLHSLVAMTDQKVDATKSQSRLEHVEMALKALSNIIKNYPGNQECVNDIAASEVLVYLLLVLPSVQVSSKNLMTLNITGRIIVLETLHALGSNTKLVKQALTKGAVIYLLDLFCKSTSPQVREKSAELLGKMTSDKLVGPKVKIALSKFLPTVFLDAMRDNPETAVHMYEGSQENPELIWNDNSRDKVSDVIVEHRIRHNNSQKKDPTINWRLPDDFSVSFSDVSGEPVVGEVFLRLFIANPAWVLRRPKEFLNELFEQWLALLAKNKSDDGETLQTMTSALIALLEAQPILADQIPNLGHLPHLVKTMQESQEVSAKLCLSVVHPMSSSERCCNAFAQTECISAVKHAMSKSAESVSLACEALNNIMQKGITELVSQALKADLINYLLNLLEGGMDAVPNPGATKAQIVKALKAMTICFQYGDQVQSILNASRVWSEYKDQKHDLFISESKTAGYLTAGASVAGYLTAGSSVNKMPDAPPPMDG
ncbi:DnaJ subfamily C member 13 [Nymphon striatum]|nr:DnaJ subfamily C member 13 [Nymphon striatum]